MCQQKRVSKNKLRKSHNISLDYTRDFKMFGISRTGVFLFQNARHSIGIICPWKNVNYPQHLPWRDAPSWNAPHTQAQGQ